MTTVFSDNYTADSDTTLASRVPDTGTGYTRIWSDGSNPTLTVNAANDDLRGVTANNSGCIYTLDGSYPSADYDFVFTLKAVVSFTDRPFYVGVRCADQENLYAVRLTNVASGARLYKKVAGTWTPLGSAFSCPAAGSVCKLEIIGTALKFYDDGVEVQSVTDSSLSAAGEAMYGLGGGAELVTSTDDANSGWQIDSITVTDLGSSPVNLSGVGNIGSAEAFGSALASVDVASSGISSGEVFGNPTLSVDLVGVGSIASGEAFGTLSAEAQISGISGIASAEAFGTPTISLAVLAASVESGEAFGSPSLSVDIASAGNIASGEAIGEPIVSVGSPVNVSDAGDIASAEAFGTPVISATVAPAGIVSSEAFGSLSLSVDIASAGNIASLEVFGTPNVSTEAPVNLTDVGGIASAEAFGTPAFEARLEPAGIASSELFGAPTFVAVIAPVGIASVEVFGTPLVADAEIVYAPVVIGRRGDQVVGNQADHVVGVKTRNLR